MSLSTQAISVLVMIGAGIITAALLDAVYSLYFLKNKTRNYSIWLVIFGVIGWILAGFFTFYLLVIVRDGVWRLYDPFAQLVGILLYMNVFHYPFRFVGRVFQRVIIRPICLVFYLVFYIIRRGVQLLLRIVSLIFIPFVFLWRKLSIKLTLKVKGNKLY